MQSCTKVKLMTTSESGFVRDIPTSQTLGVYLTKAGPWASSVNEEITSRVLLS